MFLHRCDCRNLNLCSLLSTDYSYSSICCNRLLGASQKLRKPERWWLLTKVALGGRLGSSYFFWSSLNSGRSGATHPAQSTSVLDRFQHILQWSNSVSLGIFFQGTDKQSLFIWPVLCYSNISKIRLLLMVAEGMKRNQGYKRRI